MIVRQSYDSFPGSACMQELACADQATYIASCEYVESDSILSDLIPKAFRGDREGQSDRQRWLRLQAVEETSDGVLVRVIHVYVQSTSLRIRRDERPDSEGSHFLASECDERIVSMRQEISGTPIDELAAEALEVEPGSAGVRIMRSYFDDRNQLVELEISTYPADRFAHSESFARRDEGPFRQSCTFGFLGC